MDRDKILEDLEKLQDDVWEHGFAGSNERELWLRESIADYIVKNCSIQSVSQQRELLIAYRVMLDFDIKHEDIEESVDYFLNHKHSYL